MTKKEDEHFQSNKQSTRSRSRSIVPVASYTYMQSINVLAKSKRELVPVLTPVGPGVAFFFLAGRANDGTKLCLFDC